MSRWDHPSFLALPVEVQREIATNAMERAAWDAEVAGRRLVEAIDVLCRLAKRSTSTK